MDMPNKKIRVPAEKLERFAARAFQAAGVPEEEGAVAGRMLVNTDMRGVVTHGMMRLAPWYVWPIIEKRINGRAQIQTLGETVSTAALDGDGGLGFIVGDRAMRLAVEKAKTSGIGVVNVRNVGHFGAAFNYPLIAAEQGMIGFCMTNTPPWMAAPGTGTPAIGTNPLAFAAPAGNKPPFLLDMSCTVVAAAKALREDLDIPEGWVIDRQGQPVREQSKIIMGETSLLPLGGVPSHGAYKGYGLGIMVEILTAMLAGSSCGRLHFQNGGTTWCSFFGAIDINAFLPLTSFYNKMEEMVDMLESLPDKLPGVEHLYVPGGHGAEVAEDNRVNGVPLAKSIITEHRALAEELNISIDY